MNKASDDAAGLAVTARLDADRRIYSQGIRNVSDSIGLLNVADGTLSNLSNVTSRLKELAEQSANGVYSSLQRRALDSEADALTREFNRLVQSTEFNSRKLLDGTLPNFVTQIAKSSLGIALGREMKRTTGTGSFGTATNVGNTTNDVVSGDFNGDGQDEIVYTGDGNYITVVGGANYTGSDLLTGTYSHLQVADVNNDGHDDIIAAGIITSGGGYSLLRFDTFLGTGSGTFSYSEGFTANFGDGLSEGVSVTALAVGDINNDGKVDIAYGASNDTSGARELRTALGNGSGGFSEYQSYSELASLVDLSLNDINGDGNLDITSGSASAGVKIRLATSAGQFGSESSYGSTSNAAFGDINHDGKIDFVSWSSGDTSLKFYLGAGNGTFSFSSSKSLSSNVVSLQIADLNNDGNQDVITSGTVLIGAGDGSFQERGLHGSSMGPMALGDFDNDGALDVAFSATSNQSLYKVLATTTQTTNMERLDLTTQAGAREALDTIEEYQTRIAAERGTIGSAVSRLSSSLRTLQSAQANYAEAYSRIMDTDIAAESADLVRNSILQNVTSSILSQANQIPNIVLTLLKD